MLGNFAVNSFPYLFFSNVSLISEFRLNDEGLGKNSAKKKKNPPNLYTFQIDITHRWKWVVKRNRKQYIIKSSSTESI